MDRLEIGRRGEDAAARFLCARGWEIWGRNIRCGRQELDIVAARGRIVAFIEVKSRRGRGYGHPFEAITPAKQEAVAKAARAWLRDRHLSPGSLIRFDAISVLFPDRGPPEVTHLPDAWRME